MDRSKTERPAAAVTASGPQKSDLLTGGVERQNRRKHHAHQVLAELETVADWREDLDRRIERAQLRFLYTELSPEDRIDLEAEVHEFRSICRSLTKTMRGRLT